MDLRAELCKKCIHTKVCMKDKNVFGDSFVGGNPMFTDNKELYKKYELWKAAGFPCIDYVPYNQWIPVTERLPEKFGYCIVSGGNSVWFARFENGDFNGILSGHALDSVIAWMPLPEPWKEVEA